MKTFTTLTLALLFGTAATAASAQDAHAGVKAGADVPAATAGADASAQGSANGVGTTNDSVTGRIQSTSPQASDQGQAAVSDHTGTAVQAAGTAQAGKDDTAAATGAGEATATTHGKAKAKARKGKHATTGTSAGTAAGAEVGAAANGSAATDTSNLT